MASLRLKVAIGVLGLVGMATCVAGFAIYNRYFDESGGTFCETRDAEITLSKKQICLSTGIDGDVFDPRRIGSRTMILIKYRDGVGFNCFWFDRQKFTYSTGGWHPPLFEHCSKEPLDFEMRRKAPK